MKYTYDDFILIEKNGFTYKYKDKVIEKIKKIYFDVFKTNPSSFPIPSYVKKNVEIAVLKMEEKKEEIIFDKYFNSIRLHMNKLSESNESVIFQKVKEIIHYFLVDIQKESQDYQSYCKNELQNHMFTLLSSNSFFNKNGYSFYLKLIDEFPLFMEMIQNKCNVFLEMFEHIEFIEPEDDYEKYCHCVKEKNLRKSISSFLNCFLKNNKIKEANQINIQIVYQLFQKISKYLTEFDKTNEIDHYIEIISIFYEDSDLQYNDEELLVFGRTISDYILYLSECNLDLYPSLTLKTRFILKKLALKGYTKS